MSLAKAILVFFSAFVLFLSSVSAIDTNIGAATEAVAKSGRVIVKFREAKRNDKVGSTVAGSEIAGLFDRFKPMSVTPLADERSNSSALNGIGEVRVVDFETSAAADEFLRACAGFEFVEYAEPDYLLTFFELPNDALFLNQWNLRNVGQEYYSVLRLEGSHNDIQTMQTGRSGADIQATEASYGSGDGSAVVAIIDSGLDKLHPDIDGNVWQNPGEVAGNNVDDDHNGFTDDTWGWDFSANEALIPIYSDNDPSDPHGHGTHCAGIVGAVTDNQFGISGVARHVKIMPLKIWPTMSVSLASRAVIYATDNGADVISMSWGTAFESLLLRDALQYARENGVVLCAASGNSGIEEVFFPAAYDFVIAVGATNSLDCVAMFSTYGQHLDLCAPGESILSLRARNTDLYADSPSNEPGVHIVLGDFYEASGTSMACPHVAGAVAEMRAQSPGLLPQRIEEILANSCDDLVDPRGEGASHIGKDRYSGYGRLNLKKALDGTPATVARIEQPLNGAILTGEIAIDGTALGDSPGQYTLEYRLVDDLQWSPIGQGAATITGGLLATWNTGRRSGLYELRLCVGEANEARINVLLVPRAMVELFLPAGHELSSGAVELGLNSICHNFERTIVDFRSASSNDGWTTIAQLTVPSINKAGVFWDAMDVPDGEYIVRARVYSMTGLEEFSAESIRVSSPFSGGRGWRSSVGANAAIMPNYGDFDGDSRNEIVVGTDQGVEFFDLAGKRKYAGMPVVPPGSYLVVPVVCSLDTDSVDDLVVMDETFNTIYGFGSSGETFSQAAYNGPKTYLYSASRESFFPLLFARDLDHDGRDEIIYKSGGSSAGPDEIAILSPGADESSCFPIVLQANFVQAADLDHDSVDEIYTFANDGMLKQIDLCGETTKSLDLNFGRYSFTPSGLSAVDADGNGNSDLVLMGSLSNENQSFDYYMLVLDSDFQVLRKEARSLGIPAFLDPSMAVFGDIDGDGGPESVISFHDGNYGYLFAWKADGNPVVADQPMEGLLAVTGHPGITSMPMLVELDNRSGAEAVVSVGRDLFGTFPRQRVDAFGASGEILEGWPIYVAPHAQDRLTKANVPTFGDIDGDGHTDMIQITPDNELVYTTFAGVEWNPELSPCPMWRYNRRLNNVAPLIRDVATDVISESDQLPDDYMAARNYPNPFNLATSIEYRIAESGDVYLGIYNLAGQTVRKMMLPALAAGINRIQLEAVDQSGRKLPSGVYFYRLESNGKVAAGKMVLIK